MSENEFLTVSNVCKAFGEGDSRQEVLRGMDFTVSKGEFCVLLGPSGSGKSTLLNIIGGIDSADDGYIAIATTEIDVPDAVIVRRYHSLSKIGKAFAAPESDISSNITEYWTYKGVQEYFLVAWLAFLLERRLEILLDGKYPIADIKRAMRQAACTNIGQDVFSINVQSDIFKEIEAKFGVSFDKAYATLEMIRKFHKEIVYKP